MNPTTLPFSSATYIRVSWESGSRAESVELSSDQRRPNKDAGKRLATQAVDVKRRLEAVDLSAISVAADSDVEQAEPLLPGHPIRDVLGQHDHARARRESREAAANRIAQRLEQADTLHQHGHRRALAAGKDDPIEPIEVFARAHQARARTRPFERAYMLGKGALHREDPDE